MKLLHRTWTGALHDRLVWQSASLLLAYPDEPRLATVENLLTHVEGAAAECLSRTVAACTGSIPCEPHKTTSTPSTCGGAARCI